MEKGIESAPPAAAAGTPPPLGNSLGNSLGSGACPRCQRSFSGRLSSGHRGRIREEREEEEERSDAENPGSAWGPSCNLPKSMNPHPRGSSASPCPGCWIYGISCAQGRLQLPSHSLESALLRPRHGDGRGAIPKAFSQNEPRQGARHGLGWARSPQDGHGAPGMGTDQNLLPQEMPGCPCQPQALLRSQKLLLSWRSGIIPTKQPGLGHFEISLGSWGRSGTGVSRGMNPWFVLTVTEPNVPGKPLQGKALGKPWKSGSRGSHSTANMECSECGWTEEAGRESRAKEGFAGANSPGKTTGNPWDWDEPAGITPRGRADPGTWEG